ncbi:hypothetical protein [Brevundimonas sp. NIBR11]|uniref:hypothetical protein n=1 Tax=Brevundimonas sp. NIBR11 TaxID=3015999 RepID=UPI0022EFEF25|nr:hypothetical protein [Brevundimonas sp. NIBR11]WGM31921.1 hypothetical protein KKHFBJBL_02172 [Brevundimonas sp. NIBR11]
MRRISTLAALILGVAALPVVATAQERGAIYRTPPPMNRTVEDRVRPQVEMLLEALAAEGRDYRLDGVEVFEAQDKFLPGKIASGMAHVLVATSRDDPAFAERQAAFRRLSDLTLEDVNDSWGIYYYISALHELERAGLLDEAVSPETLARLRERLDWRAFVREPELTLIDLPNNYYGVAFSIARLRFLLGWEDASASEALLAKTLQHFRDYSGEYGFADETSGEGRFDRYSVLLIGEIAQRFIETGVEPPPEVREWLRKSVDLMLPRLNMRGEGFEYGRSIGVYGETAFLEVLTAAAALDVLTDEEKAMAYAFSSRVAARYVDFWLDSGTGSVNLWDHGRKTDAYRGKHRILGENLSLSHQLIYTNAIWNRLGLTDATPDTGFEAWLGTQPRSMTTWFARGEHDRVVVTYRDGERVIGLPLINGGPTQHMNTPYFPIPYSPGVLSGAADETFPQLVPRLTFADGAVLQPLSYFKDVEIDETGDRTIVSYRQDEWDRMGETAPRPDGRAQVQTRYVLEPGAVSRSDRIAFEGAAVIDLEFPTFSRGATVDGDVIRFAQGEVSAFRATGMACAPTEDFDAATYAGTTGAFRTLIRCRAEATGGAELSWRIEFSR